jgi:peptide/nickel transport system permease protein
MIFWSRSELVTAPWISLAPGIAIVLTVVAVNLIGDALQEAAGERQR